MNPESQDGTSTLSDEAVAQHVAKASDNEDQQQTIVSTDVLESAGEKVSDIGASATDVTDAAPPPPATAESIESTEAKELHAEPIVDAIAESTEGDTERTTATILTTEGLTEENEATPAALTDAASSTDAPESSGEVMSATQSAAPATQKKFTSLNLTKKFLEKASPTLAAVPTPVASKATSAQPPSRLSAISPASRLTTAKLTSIRPAGWGQVATSSNPSSPGIEPLPSLSASGIAAASPKLVTALSGSSINRSTSPQNKGSPGLRNAALSASGRTASPSVSTPITATTNKVPWAKVKADAASAKLSSDFPTAAEAARAKQEAERREKAAAAEAAARAEQALQYLDRFRGASLGVGNHWDEMDDEDDLDEVVQFGDGTQYKVPVEPKEEPVTKEERFKDVGHDRSWPPKADQVKPPPIARTSSREPSTLSPSSTDAQAPRLYSSKAAQRVEIRGGEGISLEADSLALPSQREGRSFYRGREGGGAGTYAAASTISAPAAPAAAVPARAWGPLAQRQASLNPDAPKPAILSPPSVPKPASILSPPKEVAPEKAPAPPAAIPPKVSPVPAAASVSVPPARTVERAPPPHLAASQAAAQKIAPIPSSVVESEAPQATPYGARFGSDASASKAAVVSPAREEKPVSSVINQKEEMLSAAERARKRRQEEEEKRLAEKERAKAKAAAIEEKMRLADEEQKQKAAEAKKAEEALRLEKLRAEEASKADQLRARDRVPEAIVAQVSVAPTILSPSDEATSWRRSKVVVAAPPIAPVAPIAEARERVTVLQRAPPVATAKPTSARSVNERVFATSTGMEGFDVVINKIKDDVSSTTTGDVSIPTGPRSQPSFTEAKAQVKLPAKTPKVAIIAPNDEGAIVQKQKAATRVTQGVAASPVGVLKSRATSGPPELPVTSSEVAFDPPPVWNKYKIKLGSSIPPTRLARHLVKAQAIRVANFKSESHHSRPPNLLTWDPPITNLSTRTLSRDDLFFPKKYRKGTIITNVTIPKARLERIQKPALTQREVPVVKIPASSSTTSKALPSPTVSSAVPPKARASMRGKVPDPPRDANSPVAFARSLQQREATPSPVSFMVTSELEAAKAILPSTAPTLDPSSSVLPSPNPMAASTWGQSSLTFTGLSQQVTADPNHLREVWALPADDKASMQNSLRGIVDEEFPDVPAQYHEVGINTGDIHHSAPTSRVYSPLNANEKRSTDTNNGFSSLTSASSPSTTKSSPQARMTTANGYSPSQGKSAYQDPRRGSSNAFSAYAYPSPLQDFNTTADAGFFPMHQQQQQQQQQARVFVPQAQQYQQLEIDYNAGRGNAGYNRYRGGGAGPMSPSGGGGHMSMMSGSAAPWSIDNASYSMPRHNQQPHHQQAAYLTSPQPAHHQRGNNHQNNSRGGAGYRGSGVDKLW